MLHGPAADLGKDLSISKKFRLGIIMFVFYLLVYAGFVFIGMYAPEMMGKPVLFGLNLAFVYGMGLIVLAALMGLGYNFFCTRYENLLNKEELS